jgi:hypothetical protein
LFSYKNHLLFKLISFAQDYSILSKIKIHPTNVGVRKKNYIFRGFNPSTASGPPFLPETGTLLSALQTFPLTGELPFRDGKTNQKRDIIIS